MNNNIQLRKAERKQAKLRIGLFGPSGAGKTMSALKLARGMTEWDKICIIDTENRSADLYSKLGDYNVINIDAPFLPEKYVDAINAAVEAGMEVIIVDSITHEWAGKGGVLELVDELTGNSKNSFTVWGKVTPRHNNFIDAITACPVDIICCGRSKQEYVLNQKEGKNGQMINVPEKVGLKAVTREGFDYEMTVSFEISINHYATTSKDRTGIFMDKPEFKISEETGEIIKRWNAEVKADPAQQKAEIMRQLKRLELPRATADECKASVQLNTGLELAEAHYTEIIAKLRLIKGGEAKQPEKPKDDAPPANPPAAGPTGPAVSHETPHEPTTEEKTAGPWDEQQPAAPAPAVAKGAQIPGLSDPARELKAAIEAAPDAEALASKETLIKDPIFNSFERGVLNSAYTVRKGQLEQSTQGGTN